MNVDLTPQESLALYELLARNPSDIVLKIDRDGYILHASPAIAQWGFLLPDDPVRLHVLDLVHPSCTDAVRARYEAVMNGQDDGWIEFPALTNGDQEQWFEIGMRGLLDERRHTCGAVSIMRSIQERKGLEEQLFVTAMTDPLTGLTNRKAFMSMLEHLIARETSGCLAIFAIDYFQAMNMRHGQAFGDQVLVTFSELLRNMVRSEDIVSRIGGESMGVLLPGTTPDQVETICQRIIATLGEISQAAGGDGVPITASVGVARIGQSIDATMKQAELALFLAKAKGRNRLEMDNAGRFPWEAQQKHALS